MGSHVEDDVLSGVSAADRESERRAAAIEEKSEKTLEDQLQPHHTAPRDHDSSNPDDAKEVDIPLGLFALSAAFSLQDLLSSHGVHHVAAPAPNPKHLSPFEWPMRKKALVLQAPIFAAMMSAYAAGAYAMGIQPLMDKWSVGTTAYNVGMTVFVAGFGVTPMLLAPISEVYGRYWVFVGAGVVFFLGTLGCAVTDTYAAMLVARFVTGCGASIYATLTGGAVADLFHKEDRNTPMAMYSATIMAGTGLGPLISGPVVDRAGWRWIFYHQMIVLALATANVALSMHESRGNVLLRRKCAELNKFFESLPEDTSRLPEDAAKPDAPAASAQLPRVRFTAEVAEPVLDISLVWRSFAFPLRLLFTESVVFWFSIWVSFAWAVLYMQFGSIPLVLRDTYGFSNTQVGAVYTALVVGAILAGAMSLATQPLLRKLFPARMASPEGRLLAACYESIFLPVGLFWFGWSAYREAHWIAPTLAIGCIAMGIFSIYLAVFNYLADTYHQYSSSAQAAQSMCRNLLAGIFPLIAHLLWGNLTYGEAGSLLGAIGFALTAVPWLLSMFGEKIRARSPFAGDLKVEESPQESSNEGA